MPNKILVVDEHAVGILSSAIIEDEWFENFGVPDSPHHIKSVHAYGCVYLLSNQADENSRLLIANIGPGGVFDGGSERRHVFDRMCHIGMEQFTNTISIPVSWKPYRKGSLLSVRARPIAKGTTSRLYVDSNPFDTPHVYAYAVRATVEEFENVSEDRRVFNTALSHYVDAVLTETKGNDDAGAFGIILSEPLGFSLLGTGTLEEWYEKKLTKQQRDFVDRGHSAPVRLKGSAGTGKTLSMAVKCLRDIYKMDKTASDFKVAFITHSSSLAHDVVAGMFYALDPSENWKRLKNGHLWLGSLYELAQELLQYERKELEPLSTDGREGKQLQFIIAEDAISSCLMDTEFVRRKLSKCDQNFSAFLESKEWRLHFIADLMNEFACCIDAEGIRKGTELGDQYLENNKRELWQMQLKSKNERRVVLDIHEIYCNYLESSNLLSMDQMIADFNRYLMTHEWRRLRENSGFDIILVDEFHYFNKSERMSLHNLFRSNAVGEGNMPLYMAYDIKQSPTDAMFGSLRQESAGNMFKSVGAGRTDLVELTTIFRSTPEIAKFLETLDRAFPALDLEEEWSEYLAETQKDAGDVPILKVYKRNISLIDDIIKLAHRDAQLLGGRNVAVLCLNDRLFDSYLGAGRIGDKIAPITSREEISELKYAGKRCIFSMPEYVAGLQFQHVYLIHIDQAEFSENDSIGARRRFVSRCYLGASRASDRLTIATSAERGGPSDILTGPITNGTLLQQ